MFSKENSLKPKPPFYLRTTLESDFLKAISCSSVRPALTYALVRVDFSQLPPCRELLDDGHRRLAVGHQSLSDRVLVVVYAAAAQTALQDARRHNLQRFRFVKQ